MLKRFELHNHTTESDASISCQELLDIMKKNKADVFALTDHNTISGHRIMRTLIEKEDISCIYGMEYTTYYGHILCFNLDQYVPWDNINRKKPELLFDAVRKTGALAGIAHPYSYGYPFARGCRFDMTVTDYSKVDFIEIFNNSDSLHESNAKALRLWEDLVLEGYSLAATSGMDLHRDRDMSMKFAAYLEVKEGEAPAKALETAIRDQKTWISTGAAVLCEYRKEEDSYLFSLEDLKKPSYSYSFEASYTVTLRTPDKLIELPMEKGSCRISGKELFPASSVIVKLYCGEPVIENLVCVAPVLHPAGSSD